MNSEIEIDGKWQKCEFLYPLNEHPIEVSGQLGTSQWQQTPYKAKLVSIATVDPIGPGRYNIRHNGKQLVFEADRPAVDDVDGMLGNVL
jgi:hypothetical protein